jgi:hypothetical protein
VAARIAVVFFFFFFADPMILSSVVSQGAAAAAATSHAAEYMQRWCVGPAVASPSETAQMCALVLTAAGCGPARVPTCEHTLQHGRTRAETRVAFYDDDDNAWCKFGLFEDYPRFRDDGAVDYGPRSRELGSAGRVAMRVACFYPLFVRALSLFGRGELRALRVGDADAFRIILLMLSADARLLWNSHLTRAIESLRVVELIGSHTVSEVQGRAAAVLIERCARSVAELHGLLPGILICKGSQPVLSRCTRLEALTNASRYQPAVWLDLSHLHTLHDVDFRQVAPATIAVALPRLRDLKAHCRHDGAFSTQGFLEDLLPRLRVFHFEGTWPAIMDDDPTSSLSSVSPAPLPFLEELVWNVRGGSRAPVPPQFLGALPTSLHATYNLIAKYVGGGNCGGGGASGGPTSNPFARVRDLRIVDINDDNNGPIPVPGDPLDPSDVMRILQAAPQLRTFHTARAVRGFDVWFAAATTAPTTAAAAECPRIFGAFVHARLRYFHLPCAAAWCYGDDCGCAWRLQRQHFPRLRQVVIDENVFSVTPKDTKCGNYVDGLQPKPLAVRGRAQPRGQRQ